MSDRIDFQKALDGGDDEARGFLTLPRALAFLAIIAAIVFAYFN